MRGVTLHVLQRGAGLAERPPDFGIVSGSDDLTAAARTIAALDLMISIDSMPAHLAAAFGVRTWIPLKAESDWRWMDHSGDSPWYPTMRIFRQRERDDRTELVKAVERRLRNLAARRQDNRGPG